MLPKKEIAEIEAIPMSDEERASSLARGASETEGPFHGEVGREFDIIRALWRQKQKGMRFVRADTG